MNPGPPTGGPSFTGALTERSPVAFSRTDRIQKGPLEILTMGLPINGIAPGTYFLHSYAGDRASKSLGHTYTTLVIPNR